MTYVDDVASTLPSPFGARFGRSMARRWMRVTGLALAVVAAAVASGFILFFAIEGADAPARTLTFTTPTPRPSEVAPTPIPATWLEGIEEVHGDAEPLLISCFDENGDLRLDAADAAGPSAFEVELIEGEACLDPERHADFWAGAPSSPEYFECDRGLQPLLIVAIASAGSDLLEPAEGESLGVIDIINALQARVRENGLGTWLIISTAAIFGAEQPQTSMERWLAREISGRLDSVPCMRAVMIGHSHGGATVTSITAALDDAYADRMLGVLLDRTVALYDRPASEMPSRTQLLNFFQLNEGWHGERIDAPNVANFDESAERAPVAPSDGGGGLAAVTHKTLDDSRGVQQRVVDAIMAWVLGS